MRRAARVAGVVLSLVACGSFAVDLSAWGDHGHEIVARIAAQTVKEPTRRKMVALLRSAGNDQLHLPALLGAPGSPQPTVEEFATALARMATWPDHMPGGKGKTGPWHYVDFGLSEGPETTADRCAEGCVTSLIPRLAANIKASKSIKITDSDGTQTFGPARELRFLIHFLGDIHQPLHASTNADAGGNCVKVTGFDSPTILHSVWDTTLVDLIEKPTTAATATALIDELGGSTVSTRTPKQIASESFALAKNQVYAKTKPAAVPIIDHFVDVSPSHCEAAPAAIRSLSVDGPASFDNDAAKALVRSQLFKAGVRLARILDGIFA